MVNRIALKYTHVLILETGEYVASHGKGELKVQMELRLLFI